jgi:hypothetical protein
VGVAGVGVEPREQLVEQLDEAQAEPLEREVPLAIPMRVRDDVDLPHSVLPAVSLTLAI